MLKKKAWLQLVSLESKAIENKIELFKQDTANHFITSYRNFLISN